jgi:hypothetical protein
LSFFIKVAFTALGHSALCTERGDGANSCPAGIGQDCL